MDYSGDDVAECVPSFPLLRGMSVAIILLVLIISFVNVLAFDNQNAC